MTKTEVELLLVEDNQNDVELTTRALSKHNLTSKMHVVKDGEEALEYIFGREHASGHENVNTPKVVLLDLKLPKVNGLEVLEKLKGDVRTKMIPVVVVTSSQEPSDLSRCYELGVNSYIVKPVDYESFVKALSEAGVYWLFINKVINQ